VAIPSKELTKKDFDGANWQDVITGIGKRECFDYARHFEVKAQRTSDEITFEVFLVLAAIAGLSFHLDTPALPFTSAK